MIVMPNTLLLLIHVMRCIMHVWLCAGRVEGGQGEGDGQGGQQRSASSTLRTDSIHNYDVYK